MLEPQFTKASAGIPPRWKFIGNLRDWDIYLDGVDPCVQFGQGADDYFYLQIAVHRELDMGWNQLDRAQEYFDWTDEELEQAKEDVLTFVRIYAPEVLEGTPWAG